MTRQRVVVSIIAAAVLVGGLPIAFLLPMYTCMDHYEFEEFPGPGGGPTCAFTDTGYQPRSWLPTKITVGFAGIVSAAAVILWAQRRRFLAISILVTFTALAIAWCVLDAQSGASGL